MRTGFGRHVYAVGGNAEAARRAGINVLGHQDRLLHHLFDAGGGRRHPVRLPGQLGLAVDRWLDHAAVRGGRGRHRRHVLFGGRGKISDAILGGLVIAVIANGLPLITDESGIQFIVTGLVLLLAASVDALSRKRAMASGRA